MKKRWFFQPVDNGLVSTLSDQLGISAILAHVLVTRKITGAEEARFFLNPQFSDLHDPFLLPGVEEATERIRQAAMKNEKVMIYGDYDVDGTTATALLVNFLRLLNMRVDYYVPHRIHEGYGLNVDAVRSFQADGVKLIITVDCGVNALEEVELARDLGIDVIVTDHHEPGEELPNACAVINAKLTGSMYPFRDLSGVGVAFKLACAMAKKLSADRRNTQDFSEFLNDTVGLVALGTIADVVPLLGENRILARYGLPALQRSQRAGIDALIDSARLRDCELSSSHVGFRIAPRLNAAGRMAEARLCVELFVTESTTDARQIAQKLDVNNRERQKIQEEMFLSVRKQLEERYKASKPHAIVMANEDWHAGVLGIVASKIAEEYWRPTILIALDGDVGKGSGRSVMPFFNLFDALRGCEHLLASYGGHAQAAGVTIRRDLIPQLREHMEQAAGESLDGQDVTPALEVDIEVALSDVSIGLIQEISQLSPYGEANRPPVFATDNLEIVGQPRILGSQGKHLSFYVRQGDVSLRAIAFGMGEHYKAISDGSRRCALAYQPKINDWQGRRSVELEVKDIHLQSD